MTNKKNYKVFVTGSSGFIGNAIVKKLTKNPNVNFVYGIDSKKSNFKNKKFKENIIDICSKEQINKFFESNSISHVIHLAARTDLQGMRLSDYKENYIGVSNICDAINKFEIKNSIFASTQLVNSIGDKPKFEFDHFPDTAYGYSKSIGEFIVANKLVNRKWTIFRPTTIWGPGMSNHYKNFLSLLDRGRYFNIGQKKCFKSFGYISNVVEQLEFLIFENNSTFDKEILYLCDENPIEIKKWANDLSEALGRKKPISVNYKFAKLIATINELVSRIFLKKEDFFIPLTKRRLKNITTEYLFQSNKLWDLCQTNYSYDDAIKETIKWYREENH